MLVGENKALAEQNGIRLLVVSCQLDNLIPEHAVRFGWPFRIVLPAGRRIAARPGLLPGNLKGTRRANGKLDSLALPSPPGADPKAAASLIAREGSARHARERLLPLLREEAEALEEQCAARGDELLELHKSGLIDPIAVRRTEKDRKSRSGGSRAERTWNRLKTVKMKDGPTTLLKTKDEKHSTTTGCF